MDLGDIFGAFPVVPPTGSREPRSPGEWLTGLLGLILFPTALFLIVLFTDLWMHPKVAILVLPAGLTLATYLLCRYLQTSGRWTLSATVGCAASCFIASGIAFLMSVFFSFFRAF